MCTAAKIANVCNLSDVLRGKSCLPRSRTSGKSSAFTLFSAVIDPATATRTRQAGVTNVESSGSFGERGRSYG